MINNKRKLQKCELKVVLDINTMFLTYDLRITFTHKTGFLSEHHLFCRIQGLVERTIGMCGFQFKTVIFIEKFKFSGMFSHYTNLND